MSTVGLNLLGWKRKHWDKAKSNQKNTSKHEAAIRAFSANGSGGRNLPPLPHNPHTSSSDDAEEEGLETLLHHPYGVLPFGNIYLNEDQMGDAVRHLGLGPILRCLNDEQIICILGFLDASDLAQVSACSRYLYVASHYSDLWRDLTLRKFQRGFIFVQGETWKDTFISNTLKQGYPEHCRHQVMHAPIHVQGIFSDTFYRPWLCRSFHIQPSWLDVQTVPTENIESLTVERFITQYEGPNIPLLIKDATLSWPALHKWSDRNYLLQHSQNVLFRATSGAAPIAASFTMQSYMNYCDSSSRSMEEAPLYLFDRTFDSTCPQLKEDFENALHNSCPFFDPQAAHGHDLFGLLGKDPRPDYRWIIAGPKR